MLPILLVAFGVSMIATLLILRSSRRHGHLSGDCDFSGPQKLHSRVVPRVGGIGIFVGFTAALAFMAIEDVDARQKTLLLLMCSLPIFGFGLLEDFTKRVSPRRRLIAAAASSTLGALLLGAAILKTDIPGLDFIASFGIGSLALTVLAVTGVSHSVNIIDGMNGLASMCVVLMLAGLAYVAVQTGDPLIASLSLGAIGAVLGFFIWNFPSGHIFLGDGGAYFLGFVFSELALLLLVRNPDVSPLCPLLLCAYPVVETLFSMYRRKIVRGRSVGAPDGMHLHTLIYRRLMRWAIGSKDAEIMTRRNSSTAPYLWVLCGLTVGPAMLWWNSSHVMAVCLLTFVVFYVLLYASIVRFKTPRALVRLRQPRRLGLRAKKRT